MGAQVFEKTTNMLGYIMFMFLCFTKSCWTATFCKFSVTINFFCKMKALQTKLFLMMTDTVLIQFLPTYFLYFGIHYLYPASLPLITCLNLSAISIVIFLLFDFLFFYPLLPYLAFTLSGLYRPCDWQLLITKIKTCNCWGLNLVITNVFTFTLNVQYRPDIHGMESECYSFRNTQWLKIIVNTPHD